MTQPIDAEYDDGIEHLRVIQKRRGCAIQQGDVLACDRVIAYIDRIQTALAAERERALEEAAKVCEQWGEHQVVDRIRALRSKGGR